MGWPRGAFSGRVPPNWCHRGKCGFYVPYYLPIPMWCVRRQTHFEYGHALSPLANTKKGVQYDVITRKLW